MKADGICPPLEALSNFAATERKVMLEGFPKMNRGTKPKANVRKPIELAEDDKNMLTSIPDSIVRHASFTVYDLVHG